LAINPDEQKRALYLADQATQTKILQVASLELAAAQNQIPKEVATKVIVDTAQADPDLANVLDQYNLIKQGADGTVKVKYPDATTGKDPLTDTTKQLDDINKTDATATVKADTTDFDKTITTAQTKADDFVSTYIANLSADDHAFNVVMESAQADAKAFATTYTAKLAADPSFAGDTSTGRAGGGSVETSLTAALSAAADSLIAYQNAKHTAKLGADSTEFASTLTEAQSDVDRWARTTWVTQVDVARAADWADHVKSITEELTTLITGGGGKDAPGAYFIPIDVDRSALDQAVADIVAEFDRQTIATAYVKVKTRGQDQTQTDTTADPGDVPSTGGNRRGPTTRAMGGFIDSHRLVRVGEFGPELAILPSGSMVVPHGAAQSRLRAERARALGGMVGHSGSSDVPVVSIDGSPKTATATANRRDSARGGTTINIYNPTIHLASGNIADEIMRQTQTRNR
jgi:hypothetical protein